MLLCVLLKLTEIKLLAVHTFEQIPNLQFCTLIWSKAKEPSTGVIHNVVCM